MAEVSEAAAVVVLEGVAVSVVVVAAVLGEVAAVVASVDVEAEDLVVLPDSEDADEAVVNPHLQISVRTNRMSASDDMFFSSEKTKSL